MKVGVFTTSYPRFLDDEAGVFVGRLTDAFSEQGMAGLVLTPYDYNGEQREKRAAFSIHRYRYGFFKRGELAYGSGILPNIRQNPFRILQAPMLLGCMAFWALWYRKKWQVAQVNWIASALPLFFVCFLLRRPMVITLRGEDSRLVFAKLSKGIFRAILRSASAVVCVNEDFKSRLESECGLDEGKVHVIGNGVSVPAEEPEKAKEIMRRLGIKEKFLLFVGRMIEVKQIEGLIDLIATEELAGYQLVLVGRPGSDSYMKELELRIKENGVEDRVLFTGALAPSEVFALLHQASLYASSSKREGRPNSVLEALAAGKLVLVSDIPAHREIIRDGENGFIFDPRSPQKIARRLSELNDVEKDAIGEQAWASSKEFSWDKTASCYKEIFTQVSK